MTSGFRIRKITRTNAIGFENRASGDLALMQKDTRRKRFAAAQSQGSAVIANVKQADESLKSYNTYAGLKTKIGGSKA